MAKRRDKGDKAIAPHSGGEAPRRRRKASQTIIWVILGLVILGLGGYGATNFGGRIDAIGKVGNTPIPVDRYARALNDEMRSLQAQTGQNFTLAQMQAFGLDRAVLGRVVQQIALEDEAARAGISVGDVRLGEQVAQIPAFQGLDGRFDRQAYELALDRSGLSAREFEARLRAEIAGSIVQAGSVAGIQVPPMLLDLLVGFLGETRDVRWARIGPDALEEPVGTPSEADLVAYYEAHPEDYTLPETRRITYAWLTPDMLVDSIEVDEEALKALYEERADIYNQPERRLVERLVFPDRATAEAARARIDAGEASFEDVVAERGLELSDVDLGDVTRDALGAAGEAVFALEEPGVVGPLDSPLGPALFRMNAILPAQDIAYEEARDELLAEFAADRARRQVAEEIEPISDLLAGGATLEELAAETDMQLGSIDWTAEASEGIAAYEAFRQAAAAVSEGDFPEILELDDGGIFALRLDEIRPPELQPLEAVRERVIADWQRETRLLRMSEIAAALADAVKNGADILELGVDVISEPGIRRDGFVADTPADFTATVFEMEPGEVRVLRGDDAAFLVLLDAVHPADPEDPDMIAARERLAERARQALAQDVANAFTAAIQTDAGLVLDSAAINAVHAQFP